MDPLSEVKERRVYLSGLGESTKEADLIDRFSSFGQVSSVFIANSESSSVCRGFAHFTIRTSEAKWRRLLSALNGSSWKGQKLRIEEARPDYQTRLEREQQELAASATTTVSSPARRIRRLIRHRSCGLMTDAQIGKRKGWKRSRYGRAVALVRMRRPDGKLLTVDPAHFKDRIEKLFGSIRPLPISRLTWVYDESSTGRLDTIRDERGEDDDDDSEQSEEEKPAFSEASPEQTTNDQSEGLVTIETKAESLKMEFSLSRLLGLEEVPTAPNTITNAAFITSDAPNELGPISSDSIISAGPPLRRPPVVAPLKDLLFNPATFSIRPIPLSEYAFCRRSGKEEAYVLWREARKDLRSDFKQRLRQAKKLSRRKPKTWA